MYVINSDQSMIYKVHTQLANTDTDKMYLAIDLVLVAGKEYVAPDYGELWAFTTADAFIEEVQTEYCSAYIMDESVREALESEGYTVLSNLPRIYQYGVFPYSIAPIL